MFSALDIAKAKANKHIKAAKAIVKRAWPRAQGE